MIHFVLLPFFPARDTCSVASVPRGLFTGMVRTDHSVIHNNMESNPYEKYITDEITGIRFELVGN